MHGILPLWKPKGMTSHDCVMEVRKIYQTKKVGHTGTLDPEAEGLLPICLGEATKIAPFLMETEKTYIAEVKLGEATETEDHTGKVIERQDVADFPTTAAIDGALDSFLGERIQIPPMYSAVKVKGKKLYEYARGNETVERPKRKIHIYAIERLNVDQNSETIRFQVTCSKGTYIRTLCVDIGKKLGYPAHMSFLQRTMTANFTEKDAISLEALKDAPDDNSLRKFLQSPISGLKHLSRIEVDQATMRKVLNGQKLPRPEPLPKTDPFLLVHDGILLAVYRLHKKNTNEIKPIRVFKFEKSR